MTLCDDVVAEDIRDYIRQGVDAHAEAAFGLEWLRLFAPQNLIMEGLTMDAIKDSCMAL
jgi:hypothetical protein